MYRALRATHRGGRGNAARTVTALLILTLLSLAAPTSVAGAPAEVEQRWIVQLRPGYDIGRFVGPAERQLGFRSEFVFSRVMRGFSARLSGRQRTALAADPRVLAIMPDLPTQATSNPEVPAGVNRVGANPSPIHAPNGSDPMLDVDIAILDTGVEASHPDLRVAGGKNCTTTSSSWNVDSHGHGTHVAGTAAARDNGLGVLGVAPGARIWSVKVLNNNGNGYTSWLICGLDWVASRADPGDAAQPRIEVANMSLRTAGSSDGNCGLSNGDLLHQAVCHLDRTGVTIVAAAGNDSASASRYVPAAYPEVITVSALADYDGQPGGLGTRPSGCPRLDADDTFASFSNYGSAVDIIAPGVCVLSTFKGGGYTLMSGTSMATPHVAGAAALYHLSELSHGRPRPTPQQTRAALLSLGGTNWRTNTDPDGKPEKLLNVTSLDLPAGFALGATPASQTRSPGDTAAIDLWLARLGGFDGPLDLEISGLPSGSSWSLAGQPFEAAESGWRRAIISLPSSGAAGTYSVLINGSSAGLPTQKATVKLHFEGGIVGSPGAPRMLLRSGITSKPTALPVKIKWQKVSNAQRYRLEVSRDGGPWKELDLPSRTSVAVNTSAWPGSVYRYRLRVKKGGSWGPWLLGAPTRATPQFAGEGVTLSGQWTTYTNAKTYSEVPAYSKQAGARARLDLSGSSVSWLTTLGPGRGKARIYIDGALVKTVDLGASSRTYRRVVFSRSWTSAGNRRIEIEVRGTSGRPRVDLDAIVVVSTD